MMVLLSVVADLMIAVGGWLASRIALGPAFLILDRNQTAAEWLLLIVWAAMATDWLDGLLARVTGDVKVAELEPLAAEVRKAQALLGEAIEHLKALFATPGGAGAEMAARAVVSQTEEISRTTITRNSPRSRAPMLFPSLAVGSEQRNPLLPDVPAMFDLLATEKIERLCFYHLVYFVELLHHLNIPFGCYIFWNHYLFHNTHTATAYHQCRCGMYI
jgi:hypothetical protein